MRDPGIEDRELIDEFLPEYDIRARYEIRIKASPAEVYRSVLRSDLRDSWIVRLLMTLRTGKRVRRSRGTHDLRERLGGSGFFVLGERPDDELVIGTAGQFWRVNGGRCADLAAEDFAGFARDGYAKVAWNFKLHAERDNGTVLATETRITCFGKSAQGKFRMYWSVIGPFSGLIRKEILKHVKRDAERNV